MCGIVSEKWLLFCGRRKKLVQKLSSNTCRGSFRIYINQQFEISGRHYSRFKIRINRYSPYLFEIKDFPIRFLSKNIFNFFLKIDPNQTR